MDILSIGSVLLVAFALFVGLSFLAASGYLLYTRADTQRENLFAYGFTAFSVVMFGLILTGFIQDIANHRYLAQITAVDIISIEVGSKQITDESEIAQVVAALACSWYANSNHGTDFTGDSTTMTLNHKDSSVKTVRVAYSHRFNAAIISYGPYGQGITDSYCQSLPKVLADIGIKLPTQP